MDFGEIELRSVSSDPPRLLTPTFGRYPDRNETNVALEDQETTLEAEIPYPNASEGPLTVGNWLAGRITSWDWRVLNLAGIAGPCVTIAALMAAADEQSNMLSIIMPLLMLMSGYYLMRSGQIAELQSVRFDRHCIQSQLWDRILSQRPDWFRRLPPRRPEWIWQGASAALDRTKAARNIRGQVALLTLAVGCAAFDNSIVFTTGLLLASTIGISSYLLAGRFARYQAIAARYGSAAEKAVRLDLDTLAVHRLMGDDTFLHERAMWRQSRAHDFVRQARQASHLLTTIKRIAIMLSPAGALIAAHDQGIGAVCIGAIVNGYAAIAAWEIGSATGPMGLQLRQIQRAVNCLQVPAPDCQNVGPITRIEVRDLHFAFDGSPVDRLVAVNLVAESGDLVAITGPSGSGKSTLLRLVAGLLQPRSGSVLINGRLLQEIDGASYRLRIGAVFQEIPEQLSTIRTAIGDHEAALSEVKHAADIVGIASTIEALPMRYQTLILNGTIATGLFEQIRIARAVLRSPDVIILDEALTHLDPANVSHLFSVLKARGAIVFFCSHNPDILSFADRTLHLGPLGQGEGAKTIIRATPPPMRADETMRSREVTPEATDLKRYFRAAAVQRLASPDQLDEPATIYASGLLPICAGIVLLGIALVVFSLKDDFQHSRAIGFVNSTTTCYQSAPRC